MTTLEPLKGIFVLILTIVLLQNYGLNAQSTKITGTVSDQFGNLPGAVISIEGTTISTATDVNGNFSLALDAGDYRIKASFVMYLTQERELSVYLGDSINLEFILKSGFGIDEEVSVGTRATPRTLLETSVPVDVFSQKSIGSLPQSELGQILHYTAPSFHSVSQTIADGTDHIDPATLRGLGTDQVLVLINGKRRHTSSLLNLNGTLGRGSVGTDFNAIPLGAVDRIEILRDGATAQYGSDAIAGVINIVLKEQTGVTHMDSRYGMNQEGDGETAYFSGNTGFALGNNSGFVNLTLEYRDRASTNRSGNYTGPVYINNNPVEDMNIINDRNFFEKTGYSDQRVMEVGNAAARNLSFFFNAEVPVSNAISIYGHGGRNFRDGQASGFYRFPKDSNLVVHSLYADGFSPKIRTGIKDDALTIGLRGTRNHWNLDFSNTNGSNQLDYNVVNSNNASLGNTSPIRFYSGGFIYNQNTTNLDVSKSVDWLQGINVAFGAEMRIENYQILAGDEASYINGKDSLVTDFEVIKRAAGSQGFPGFHSGNELSELRTNNAWYFDLESNVTDKLLLGSAVRYETYSDFGDQFTGKFSGRYRLKKWVSINSSYSTGFRAPSLHQVYFNNVSIQFIDDEAVRIGTFNNESTVASAFNIDRLKSELSNHLSIGGVAKIGNNLTLTFDYYSIKLKDRIVLSGKISEGFEEVLRPLNVRAAQLFTNALDTRTTGVDMVATYKRIMGTGEFFTNLGINITSTKVQGGIHVPDAFKGNEETFFNREDISRIESAQPNFKAVSQISYQLNKLTINMNNTFFGKVSYVHADDGNQANWELNALTNQVESRDQVFSQKLVSDLSFSWQFSNNIKATLGGHNVFNVYPDKHKHSSNISEGRFIYSRRVQQFGVKGAHYFVGLSVQL